MQLKMAKAADPNPLRSMGFLCTMAVAGAFSNAFEKNRDKRRSDSLDHGWVDVTRDDNIKVNLAEEAAQQKECKR